jgi:hypothetical protein
MGETLRLKRQYQERVHLGQQSKTEYSQIIFHESILFARENISLLLLLLLLLLRILGVAREDGVAAAVVALKLPRFLSEALLRP